MGMYDYINGEQIKCFYSPIFNKDYGVWHSGGSLIGYSNGDELPLKTMYYKYASNLAILDIIDIAKKEYLLHIIKDGKVFKSVSGKDLIDEDLKNIESFINYYGTELNIKSKKDIINFINEKENIETSIKNIRKDAKCMLDSLNKSIQSSRRLKLEKAVVIEFIKEDDIQKSSLKGYTLEKLKEEKSDLLKNETLLEELQKIVLKRLKVEHKLAFKKYDEEDAKCQELLNPLSKQFNERWLIDKYSNEKFFGELLYCLTRFLTNDGKLTDNEEDKNDFKLCIKELFKLIEDDKNIINSYIYWQSNDDEKYKAELEEILDDEFIKRLKSELEEY